MQIADRVAAAKKAYDEAMNLGAMQSDAFHAAIAAALSAEEPEPVAWGNFKSDGTLVGLAEEKNERWTGAKPLYAAPPAPSVAVKDLEWEAIGTRMFVATTPVGVNYQLQEFSSWTNNPFQLVVREADDGNTKVSFYLTLDEAKVAAQADYEARIRSALSAQVQDVAAKSLADAYQKYLDAVNLYNERHAIMKTKALGTMRVDEEYKAIDEARRSFDKLAVDIAKSALTAAPAKQEG